MRYFWWTAPLTTTLNQPCFDTSATWMLPSTIHFVAFDVFAWNMGPGVDHIFQETGYKTVSASGFSPRFLNLQLLLLCNCAGLSQRPLPSVLLTPEPNEMIVSLFKGHLRKVTHSTDEQESWSVSCMRRTWVTSSFTSARKQACCNVCFFCNNSDRRSCVFLIREKTDRSFFCSFALWCLFLMFFSCRFFFVFQHLLFMLEQHTVPWWRQMIYPVLWLHSPWNQTIVRHAYWPWAEITSDQLTFQCTRITYDVTNHTCHVFIFTKSPIIARTQTCQIYVVFILCIT